MKIHKRTGYGYRLELSVPGDKATALEQAINYLVKLNGVPAATYIIDLVIDTARRAGWREDTVQNEQVTK